MDLFTDAFNALWRVAAVGLLLGAGLPALFALGMRNLYGQLPTEAAAHDAPVSAPTAGPAGRVIAFVCFGVVILAVAVGIAAIVLGKRFAELFG